MLFVFFGVKMATNEVAKMSERLKDLCRLCAKQHEISKDLLDESNKNALDLIQQFTKITVTECDNMPTKLCLDCEERMVSFQLFILECYKVQDSLRKMCLENSGKYEIKPEAPTLDFDIPELKTEIKVETSSDEDEGDEKQDNTRNNAYMDDHYDGDDFKNYSSEEDELDHVTIASLKKKKVKSRNEKKVTVKRSRKTSKKRQSIVDDFVKLNCSICNEELESWPCLRVHFLKKHQMKPVVFCSCGYKITSRTILYQHVADHAPEIKRAMKENSDDSVEESHSKVKVRDFVVFKCQSCGKLCSSWYTLQSHCQRSHKLAPEVTCSCGVTLRSKSVMYKHIQDHKNPSNLSCDICSKIMKSAAALEKHQLKHVPKSDRKFSCDACDKVFGNRELLRSHQRSHIPIEERKVFSCDVCNLKFTTRSSAMSHRRVVHEKVKAYVCDLCGYACGTNGELRQHRAIHSDDKPFVCGKCNKPFKTYSNLKTHLDTHEDTSYVCYVCSRVLNSRRTLRKHLLVHEDKCRHVCSYCNKAFKRRQTLKVHMHTHTGDKPLSCKWCDERFSYASTLRSHRLRAHPDKMAHHAALPGYSPAAQPHLPPPGAQFTLLQHPQEDYIKGIKNDLAAIGIHCDKAENDSGQMGELTSPS